MNKMKTPPAPEDPKKPKRTKSKRAGVRHHGVVRVHLPPIESYEKELEFTADGPGRVLVRLERLMGTDRVRLTDTKYMGELLERLEEQERKAWAKKRYARIKKERSRFRQLAIDGLMNPEEDMQDLYNHPVFRANRVLNNLKKMNSKNAKLLPLDGLPPIVEVDPFLDDDTGAAFKSYPGHSEYREYQYPSRSTSKLTMTNSRVSSRMSKKSKINIPSSMQTIDDSQTSMRKSHVTLQEPPAVDKKQSSGDAIHKKSVKLKSTFDLPPVEPEEPEQLTLEEMQEKYEIPEDKDLNIWKPFHSQLASLVNNEEGQGAKQLYTLAEDVVGVYGREVLTGDDFSTQLGRLMRTGMS